MRYKSFILSTTLLCLFAQSGFANSKTSHSLRQKSVEVVESPKTDENYEKTKIKVIEIVAKQLGIKIKDVKFEEPLSKQKIAADELDAVEIIMSVEEAFNIEIKDEDVNSEVREIPSSLTVKKLTDLVLKNAKK
jgi:acyl carrier protein